MIDEIITKKMGLLSMLNDAIACIENDVVANAALLLDVDAALGAFEVAQERDIRQCLRNGVNNFDFKGFEKLYREWLQTQLRLLNVDFMAKPNDLHYGCDQTFKTLCNMLKEFSQEAIEQSIWAHLETIKNESPSFYQQITVGYRGWYFDNWLDGFEGPNNSLITNRVCMMKQNVEKLIWLYSQFADFRSRESLNAILINWLTFSMDAHNKVANFSDQTVCDADIHPVYEQEVYVDCGAYIGDTAFEYAKVYNIKHKHIHTYDISESTVKRMEINLAQIPNVTCHQKGVGEHAEKLTLKGSDLPFEGNKLESGVAGATIPVVRLDDDILQDITFLKVDVEGMDKEALRGAAEHIRRTHPKLVVDIYHKLADLVDVALLINELDPTYRFYLRCNNSLEHPLYCATKYALYAI